MRTGDDLVRSRLAAIISHGREMLKRRDRVLSDYVPLAEYARWEAQAMAFLLSSLDGDDIYTQRFEAVQGSMVFQVEKAVAILEGLFADLEAGYRRRYRDLVISEVFSDFLEMASHLLDAGYKDPAAMLAGATLEDGIKRIGLKSGITVRAVDDISAVNNKLAQKGVYNALVQKKVLVLNQTRNWAVHGEFGKYSAEDARTMISGVTDFLTQFMS